MGKKSSAAKSAGGQPAWLEALATAKQPALWIIVVFVTFKWCLPFLAELTPPGVDIKIIQKEAEMKALRQKDRCATVCDGMTCPDGWDTGRSPEDQCKCICVRKQQDKPTEWDKKNNQQQYFEMKKQEDQATHSRHQDQVEQQ